MLENNSNALSYTKGAVDIPLQRLTIGTAFDQSVQRYPDHQALIVPHQGIEYSYRQLQSEVNKVAKAFLALNVNVGDRVGIWAGNCSEWLLCQLATAKIGAILVNINPAYQQAELAYTLKHASISVLVMAEQFKKSNFISLINQLAPELSHSNTGDLVLANFSALRRIICLSNTPTLPSLTDWSSFCLGANAINDQQLERVQASLTPEDPINILQGPQVLQKAPPCHISMCLITATSLPLI